MKRIFPGLYDLVMRAAELGALARWRRAVAAPSRGRTLEIGAGTGLDFRHYPHDAIVIATDVDEGMLRRAQARARCADARILLVVADAETLPFAAHAFDSAVIALALCTIPRPARALAELRRVLCPGASLRLMEHVRHPRALVGRAQDLLTPVWRHVAGGCRLNRRTAETIAASGFALEHVANHAGGLVVEIAARAPAALDARADSRAADAAPSGVQRHTAPRAREEDARVRPSRRRRVRDRP